MMHIAQFLPRFRICCLAALITVAMVAIHVVHSVAGAQYINEPSPAAPEESQIVFSSRQFAGVKPVRMVASTMMVDLESMTYGTDRYRAEFLYWRNRPGFMMARRNRGLPVV